LPKERQVFRLFTQFLKVALTSVNLVNILTELVQQPRKKIKKTLAFFFNLCYNKVYQEKGDENMITLQTYYINYQRFLNGLMSESDWIEFTKQVFDEILEENKETFVRFENEWAE